MTSIQQKELVDVIVSDVDKNYIIVDIEGFDAKIGLEEISKEKILDARQFFSAEDEIKIKVKHIDEFNNIYATIKDTDFDPVKSLNETYSADTRWKVKITDIER